MALISYFLTSCKIYEVNVGLGGTLKTLISLRTELRCIDLNPEDSMTSTTLMIENGFCVMTITLSLMNELNDFF